MAEPIRPAASLDGATVRFAERTVGPLDLIVLPGTITAIVGASGSGKSTALNLLAGLRTPDAGRAAPGAASRVSMVFQSPTLMPWANALSNVALPLELAGTPREEARARALDQLVAVGLGDRANALPRELSGGMAMRCALARALVTAPDLLLLDEPFAALDSVTRVRLIDLVTQAWAKSPGLAVVLVTHDVHDAARLAQRVLVLDPRGAVAADVGGARPSRHGGPIDPERARETADRVSAALAAAMEPAA
ncbi:MAG TPA: ABC transporter ATP-binding protein [Brevundimonas sp.]|uniref:ABC transporter ATP-binding protein n=1 Tax=Brevundimonas sp. TaxID=1871086 RepID=UPI002DE6C1AD|nr:ABC transporter ATP-binding protein [Brevundimonas sp.]